MLNSEMSLAFFFYLRTCSSMKKQGLFFFFFLSLAAFSQDLKYYRYDKDFLTKEFYKSRRDALRKEMPDSSMAVLFSAPERNRANDDDFQYHQDPNFYYLTGHTEPNALLLVFKNPQTIGGVLTDECLFVQERDPTAEVWTGRRLGTDGAKQLLGFTAAFIDETFDTLPVNFKSFSTVYYLALPKGAVDDKTDPADLYNLIEEFKKKTEYPPSNGDNFKLAKWLSALREVKQPEEIALMRKAISMSCDGHIEMMKALKPGMSEYQVQAVGEYEFKKNGSEYVAYPSICGGGENSCILHYENNRRPLESKDVLLLDMGAEYHGYAADVTRTLPVGGKFSEDQKTLYRIVFEAQEAGFKACKPGNDFSASHKAASEVIKKGLLDLGIIKEEKDFRKYFMHGTSHYLGLDVHDKGSYENLKAGNVITVEPGIYIPDGSPCDPRWWNIGIRIEDDILITETGYENLSAKTPRTIEKIEELMKSKKLTGSSE